MSDIITSTSIWKNTLAHSNNDESGKERERLRSSFISFREKVKFLAGEIHTVLPEFTVHDISHLDALWEMADIIIGKDYNLTPTEAFVLGGSILLHDLGMALVSYPNGIDDIKKDVLWEDTVTSLYISNFHRTPTKDELISPEITIRNIAVSNILRSNHAKQAEKLSTISWQNPTDKTPIFLIDDVEIRQVFGRIIGKIAHSHWWDIGTVEVEFSRTIGAPSWCPREWTIDPLKIACILRVADASNIDSRRAPIFLRTLRKVSPSSDKHWGFQEKIQKPYLSEDSLNYSSGYAFPYDEAPQWWLCYETLNVIDKELRQVDMLLADKSMERFSARRVFGVESPERLLSLIPTEEWFPFDAFVHIGDIPKIIKCLGGDELYGKNPDVAIRELIQNSSDAVRARRIIDGREDNWGEIAISYGIDDIGEWIEVSDNGLGMSVNVIKNYLLDFGNSYWNSDLFQQEYPGAISRGIKQTGKYGIGFFSVFMLGDKVQVITRQSTAGQKDTLVLEFTEGIRTRPVIRKAAPNEYLRDGGTSIKIWLSDDKKIDEVFLKSNYGVKISFEEFCLSIAPSLDCNLTIIEDNNNIRYIANHWIKCSNEDFLDLMIKINKIYMNSNSKQDYAYFYKYKDNFELIINNEGEVLGRACLIPMSTFYSTIDIDLNGLLTIGGLSSSRTKILGILKATTINAARETGQVLASKEIISKWSTSQAAKVKNICVDNKSLLEYSSLIKLLGGEPCDLPIARTIDKFFSADEFINFLSNKDTIIILDTFFLEFRLKDLKGFIPETNVVFTHCSGISSTVFTPNHKYSQLFLESYDERKHWQYNKTNLGFIIECIHKAWGISIDELKNIIKSDSICLGKYKSDLIYEDAYLFLRSTSDK